MPRRRQLTKAPAVVPSPSTSCAHSGCVALPGHLSPPTQSCRARTHDLQDRLLVNQASNTAPMEIHVSDQGPAVLVVRNNADAPETGAVGIFQDTLPTATVSEVVQACQRMLLSARPQLPRPVPGELVREISVRLGDGPTEVRNTVMGVPPDQPFLAAEKVALALADGLRRSPRTALTSRTSIRLDSSAHLQASIRLTNVGKDLLAFPAPDAWHDGEVSFQVTALRNDVPVADLRDNHQRFLYLSRPQLVATLPASPPDRTIAIAPQRDLVRQFEAELLLSPGSYDVRLLLEAPIFDAQGTQIIRAEMYSVRVPVRVSPPAQKARP